MSFLVPILLAIVQTPGGSDALGDGVGVGEFGQLPLSATARQADHLASASNDSGHVFVAWHSNVAGPGLPKKLQAEGCLLWRGEFRGKATWHTTGNVVLGDPTLNLWSDPAWGGTPLSSENCVKPTVTAVGENFVVCWPRVDVSSHARRYVIESVLIVPTSHNTPAEVICPSPGQGYRPWDPAAPGAILMKAGESGETLHAARIRGGVQGTRTDVAVVAAMRSIKRVDGVVDKLIDYSLMCWEIDFSSYLQNPVPTFVPYLATGTTLDAMVDEVHGDQVGNKGGGRVPPFLRETKAGGLVMTYDVMQSEERPETVTQQGKIVVKHFTPVLGSPGEWTLADSDQFQSATFPDRYHRRSNLVVDFDDPFNEYYSVAWMVIKTDVPLGQKFADGTGAFGSFELDSSDQIVNVQEFPGYTGPVDTVVDSRSVFSSHPGPHFEFMLGANDAAPLDDFEIFAWHPLTGTLDLDFIPEPTTFSAYEPRRPWAVSWNGPNAPANDPLVIVFDARIGTPASFACPLFYVREAP